MKSVFLQQRLASPSVGSSQDVWFFVLSQVYEQIGLTVCTTGFTPSPISADSELQQPRPHTHPHTHQTHVHALTSRSCTGACVQRRNRSYFNRTDLEIGL